MPLQNRVDPFGNIHAVPDRGLFTGNRGSIHDPKTRTLLKHRWTAKAWLICECDFGGRRRDVMGRNAPSGGPGWTELFFLDEVTALAAGHRPCFFCRRERAKEFTACFGEAFGIADPTAGEIDAALHGERLASGGPLIGLAAGDIASLPEGAMLSLGERCFAKHRRALRAWTFGGYAGDAHPVDALPDASRFVTPRATIAVLKAGYRPVWHPSIELPRASR